MKGLLFVFAMLGSACGGDCIPKTVKTAASFALVAPAKQPFAVAHSADELRAFVAGVTIAPPPQSMGMSPMEPADRVKAETQRLDAFVAETSFATTDVVLVRAGGNHRAQLVGATTDGSLVTLYFTGHCSPCAGGDRGSYEEAGREDQYMRLDRTDLVRVAKNAHVEIRECSEPCGTCGTNVP